MKRFFKFLVGFFKGIGWKKFLRNLLICVATLGIIFTLFFLVGMLISAKPVLGIIVLVALILTIIGIQALIVKKYGRDL